MTPSDYERTEQGDDPSCPTIEPTYEQLRARVAELENVDALRAAYAKDRAPSQEGGMREALIADLLKECADDLEAEFRHKYRLSDGTLHPAQQRDFDRDMDLVVRARAALAHDGGRGKDAPQ